MKHLRQLGQHLKVVRRIFQTLDWRCALKLSVFKQTILGQSLHLKTDLHLKIQLGISSVTG